MVRDTKGRFQKKEEEHMTEQFDFEALNRALTKKERVKTQKEKTETPATNAAVKKETQKNPLPVKPAGKTSS